MASKEDEIRRAIEEAEKEDKEEAKRRQKQEKEEAEQREKQEKEEAKNRVRQEKIRQKEEKHENKNSAAERHDKQGAQSEKKRVSKKPLYAALILIIAGVCVILFAGGFLTFPFAFTANAACGSADNLHIIAAKDRLTAEENASIRCFNERLISCGPATFEATGQGGMAYEINGTDGANCIVSGGGKICKIPRSFISDTANSARSSGSPEMTFLTVAQAISEPPRLSGENQIDCT